MKQIKNKKECKEKKKNIGVCYGGNCSNEQFSNCYPMSKEDTEMANLGIKEYNKMLNEEEAKMSNKIKYKEPKHIMTDEECNEEFESYMFEIGKAKMKTIICHRCGRDISEKVKEGKYDLTPRGYVCNTNCDQKHSKYEGE